MHNKGKCAIVCEQSLLFIYINLSGQVYFVLCARRNTDSVEVVSMLSQWCYNVGPPSATASQHYTNIWLFFAVATMMNHRSIQPDANAFSGQEALRVLSIRQICLDRSI